MKSIAFVTTSRGRLHHIRQTLPLMVAQAASEVVVVDYDCPDRTGDWVEANFPEVKVVRVTDDPEWCQSRARNLGGRRATAEWLVFIDGDIMVGEGWTTWMQENLQPGQFYRAGPIAGGARDPETYGTMLCTRADFEAVGGYDEVFRGWGGDDDDFFRRLAQRGLTEQTYPSDFVTAISHGDEERAGWAGLQDKLQKTTLNYCYMAGKSEMERVRGSQNLPLNIRQELMDGIRSALLKWFEEGAATPLPIRYVLRRSPRYRLPGSCTVSSELTFTLNVDPPRQGQ